MFSNVYNSWVGNSLLAHICHPQVINADKQRCDRLGNRGTGGRVSGDGRGRKPDFRKCLGMGLGDDKYIKARKINDT